MSGLDDATEPAKQEAPPDQEPDHSAGTVAAPDPVVPSESDPAVDSPADPTPADPVEADSEPIAESGQDQESVREAVDAIPAVVESPVEVPAETNAAAAPTTSTDDSPAAAGIPPVTTVDAAPAAAVPEPAVPPVAAGPEPAASPAAAVPEPAATPVAAAPEPTVPPAAAGSEPATAPPAGTAGAGQPPVAPSTPPPAGETADGAPPPPSAPPRPRPVTETGKIVEGLVTAVSSDSVELTLDDGRHAVIHRRNFGLHDEDPSTVVSVGDRAFGAELVREDPKSRVVLSRAWALKRQAWEKIVSAAANNELLKGRVLSASKKGLVVDVGVRGFVPSSHLELETVTDMTPYADQTLELKILEVDPRREKLVLSRRALLLKAQRKEIQQLLSSLKKGEVRTGKVASLADYGAFVDLGGVSGLVHISELSWRRVAKPSEVVKVGDEVEVKVLDIKPKKKRISLSIRQITPDPLKSIDVGSIMTGTVTRLVDFGAFVAIGEFEGLVHLSELAEYRVSTPEEIVAPGDEVGVKVLSVDTKRRRIELSIRRAAEYGG